MRSGDGLISRLRKASTGGSNNEWGAAGEGARESNPAVPFLLSSLYGCALPDVDLDTESEDVPVPASVLTDPTRTICVVTTAALPWRTGTAVNPLLRALYLVRFQRERRRKNPNYGAKAIGSVALVIPWLEALDEREKLYGTNTAFANGSQGMREQEEWIRNYAKERCGMTDEAKALKIIFYPAFYLAGFGSIFPKVDLCNFIPPNLVDVAILEEPEHLNWFRMPSSPEDNIDVDETMDESDLNHEAKPSAFGESGGFGQKIEITINSSKEKDESEHDDAVKPVRVVANDHSRHKNKKQSLEKAKLGWTHRFRFVVGIVHTNYEAYARQYGIGASLIAAPAIGAVSALTIRAYCHKVIKLSDTLPSFAPGKEVTCNVHGVRREFLEGTVDFNALSAERSNGTSNEGMDSPTKDDEPAAVYFIGKLVWAKGFDIMLELQDIFRGKYGQFFPIDIYGGGPDEKAIARAFHGRNHSSPTKRPPPTKKGSISPSSSYAALTDPKDMNAKAVFANPNSIKAQSNEVIEQMKCQGRLRLDDDVVSQYLSLGFEVSGMNLSMTDEEVTYVKENRREEQSKADPLDILGDLSGKSFGTGLAASHAVYNIADSSIKSILAMSFSQLKSPLAVRGKRKEKPAKVNNIDEQEEKEKPRFMFDPPQSRYEWRRHPIPAKFPGVIDHAQLKAVPHKIFLNPSTSEVLCTTTAEALAMGKFVIIPNHPSNTFFLQFTNCLSYDTLLECAEKMQWALINTPSPLSEEERRKFTWEAATERLMSSSIVAVRQAREWAESGMDRTDARIAYWLSESGEKGNMIRNLFHRKSEAREGDEEEG